MVFFTLTTPDLIFFIILAVIFGAFGLAYILTPIVKKKQFEEARANLKKREETFRANLKNLNPDAYKEQKNDVEETV